MKPCAAEGEHVTHPPQGAQLPTDCKRKQLMRTSERCCAACRLKMLFLAWRHWCASFCTSSRVVSRCLYLYMAGHCCQDHHGAFHSCWQLFCWLSRRRPPHFSEIVTQQERMGNNHGGLTFPQQAYATTQAVLACQWRDSGGLNSASHAVKVLCFNWTLSLSSFVSII